MCNTEKINWYVDTIRYRVLIMGGYFNMCYNLNLKSLVDEQMGMTKSIVYTLQACCVCLILRTCLQIPFLSL